MAKHRYSDKKTTSATAQRRPSRGKPSRKAKRQIAAVPKFGQVRRFGQRGKVTAARRRHRLGAPRLPAGEIAGLRRLYAAASAERLHLGQQLWAAQGGNGR